MTVSGTQILHLRVVSSSSGSGQSEISKYISCVFEGEYFMKIAVRSVILFSRVAVASVKLTQ